MLLKRIYFTEYIYIVLNLYYKPFISNNNKKNIKNEILINLL